MSLGPWQIILVIVLIVLLFGRGQISELMGDVAKGITSFKKGLAEDSADKEDKKEEPKVIGDNRQTETDLNEKDSVKS